MDAAFCAATVATQCMVLALAASPELGKWTVKRAEKIVRAGQPDAPVYELLLTSGKSGVEVVFAADGKLLERHSHQPK